MMMMRGYDDEYDDYDDDDDDDNNDDHFNNRKDASLTGVNQGRERKVAAAGGQSSISSSARDYII